MKVALFGLGYVGAVTAAALARDGHSVVGVDVASHKIDAIRGGKSPVVERSRPRRPDQSSFCRKNWYLGRLNSSTGWVAAGSSAAAAVDSVPNDTAPIMGKVAAMIVNENSVRIAYSLQGLAIDD